LNGVGDQLAGPLTTQPGWARFEHLSCQASAQLANDTARTEPAGSFKAEGAERPCSDYRDEDPKVTTDLAERLSAWECTGDHAAEQNCLRDYQQRGHYAQNDGADERHAR
jgi:hypothetical protein